MKCHTLYRTVRLEIVILICFIESSEIHTTPVMCERIKNDGCCNGYFWNQTTRNCTKCMTGYTGPNCFIRCPYPSFGENCQGYCNCSNDTCDASTGCTTLTTDDKISSLLKTSTYFWGNTTFRSLEKHTLKFSGDDTSILATMEFTHVGNNTVFNTTNGSKSRSLGAYNHTLILLIKGFGGVDIFLICTYSVILMIDRYNQKSAFQTNNRGGYAPRTNSMYENIETVFSPND